jgi:preprotein translocase subunit SecD
MRPRRTRSLGIVALLLGLAGCGANQQASSHPGTQSSATAGFELRYRLAPQSPLAGSDALAALDQSLAILRARAGDLGLPHARIAREGNEIIVDVPGENELSVADLRELLPVQGQLEFRLDCEEGDFMTELCTSLSSDSKAGVMRIETGMDAWQDASGAHIKQCYLAANDRVAMLNAEEAEAEGCRWRGDSERTRCVVSGRSILSRYLAGRGDIEPEAGCSLVFEASESSAPEGESGERYWRSYYVELPLDLSRAGIAAVEVQESPDMYGDEMRITFDEDGKRKLAALSATHLGRKLAILIDGDVQSALILRSVIDGGVLTVSLGPTSKPAAVLAAALRSGALPAPLVEVQARGN